MTDLSCLSCPLCCKQNLGSVEALREHLLFFTYRPIPCPVCRAPITGLPRLVGHLELHLDISCDPLVADAPSQLNQKRNEDEGEEQFQQHHNAPSTQELTGYCDKDKGCSTLVDPFFNTEKTTLVQLDLLSVQKELSANSLYDFSKHEAASVKTCSVEELKDCYLDVCSSTNGEQTPGTSKHTLDAQKGANSVSKWTNNNLNGSNCYANTATTSNFASHRLQSFSVNDPNASDMPSQEQANAKGPIITAVTQSSSLSPALQQNNKELSNKQMWTQEVRNEGTQLLSTVDNTSTSTPSYCESTVDSTCPSIVDGDVCSETSDRPLPSFGDNPALSSVSSHYSSPAVDVMRSSWGTSSTTTAIRAYVCQQCDLKVVGQDLYFVHLQAHLNDSASLAEQSRGASNEKIQSFTTLGQQRVNVCSNFGLGKYDIVSGSFDVSSGKSRQNKSNCNPRATNAAKCTVVNNRGIQEQTVPSGSLTKRSSPSLDDQLDYSSGRDSLSPELLKGTREEQQTLLHSPSKDVLTNKRGSLKSLEVKNQLSSDYIQLSSNVICSKSSNIGLDHHHLGLAEKKRQHSSSDKLSAQSILDGSINSPNTRSIDQELSNQTAVMSANGTSTTLGHYINPVSACHDYSTMGDAGNVNTSVVSDNNNHTVNAGNDNPTIVARYNEPTVYTDHNYNPGIAGSDDPTMVGGNNNYSSIAGCDNPPVVACTNDLTVIGGNNVSSSSQRNNSSSQRNNSSVFGDVANSDYNHADSINCENEIVCSTIATGDFNSFSLSENISSGLPNNDAEDCLLDISLNSGSPVLHSSHQSNLSTNYPDNFQQTSHSSSVSAHHCSLIEDVSPTSSQFRRDFAANIIDKPETNTTGTSFAKGSSMGSIEGGAMPIRDEGVGQSTSNDNSYVTAVQSPQLSEVCKDLPGRAVDNSSPSNSSSSSEIVFDNLTLVEGDDEALSYLDEIPLVTKTERLFRRPTSKRNEGILDSFLTASVSSNREKKHKLDSIHEDGEENEAGRSTDSARRSSKSTRSSKEPYFHKKFHHERKGTVSHCLSYNEKRDVGKYYIPNLQSVWVNRLNDSLAKNNANIEPLMNDYYEDDDYLEHRKESTNTSHNDCYERDHHEAGRVTANASREDLYDDSDEMEGDSIALRSLDSTSNAGHPGENVLLPNTTSDGGTTDTSPVCGIDMNDVCDPTTDRAAEEVETTTLTDISYNNYYCEKNTEPKADSEVTVTKQTLADISDDLSSESDSCSNMMLVCDSIGDFDSESFEIKPSFVPTKKTQPEACLETPLSLKKTAKTSIASYEGVQKTKIVATVADARPKKRAGQHSCSVCDKTFLNSSNIRRHMREAHNPKRDLTCKECKRKFCSERQLVNHMGVHRQQKMHACNLCGHRCFTVAGIRTHKFEIHNRKNGDDDQKSFKCQQCPEAFTKKFSLLRHVKRKHDQLRYPCPTCDKLYTCSENLQKHMQSHSSDGPQGFPCGACDSLFKSKFALKRHQSIRHPGITDSKTEGRNMAVLSNQKTVPNSNVTSESSQNSGQSSVVTVSEICSERGNNKVVESTSQVLSTVSSASLDTITDQPLPLANVIKNNKKKAQSGPEQNCKDETNAVPVIKNPPDISNARNCDSTTSPNVTLSGSAPTPVSVVRRFVCSQCPQRFTRKDSLTQHLRAHSDERPFVCNICDMVFSRRGLLNTHRDKHASSPRHRCQYCDKMFKFKVSLKHHSCLSKRDA